MGIAVLKSKSVKQTSAVSALDFVIIQEILPRFSQDAAYMLVQSLQLASYTFHEMKSNQPQLPQTARVSAHSVSLVRRGLLHDLKAGVPFRASILLWLRHLIA